MIETAVPADTAPVSKVALKRPLWRRVLRGVKWTVATVLVLVVVLVAFLHTSWGKSVVRGRIESRLANLVNGEVTLGSLDYGFLFSDVELGEFEIKDASGRPAIRIASLSATIDRGSLLDGTPLLEDLKIDGLAVQVIQTADGKSNLTGLFKPSDRKPLERIRIAGLSVTGSATITKPDGSTIAITDLAIAGDVDARPATKAVDVVLAKLDAKVAARGKNIDVALADLKLGRRPDSIDVSVRTMAAGALGIDTLSAHVELADGKLAGKHAVTIGKARVDSKQLAKLLGREVLLDDVALELGITGPSDKLALHGNVRTRETKLSIDGTVDISTLARPSYQLALVGRGRSSDVVRRERVPNSVSAQSAGDGAGGLGTIEGDVRIDVTGSGASAKDLDAVLAVVVGPTKVGKLAVDSITAKAVAKQGAYKLDELVARGLGFEIDAAGELAGDKAVTGKVRVHGKPVEAMKVLAAAGISINRKIPALDKLDVTVNATGNLDGTVALDIVPTRIAIAGGRVTLAGQAQLVKRKLDSVNAKVTLSGIDLASASRLAGRPPKLQGTLDGVIDLTRSGATQLADYDLTIKLRDPAVHVIAKGHANRDTSGPATSGATARADVVRTSDNVVLATLDAQLPLDKQGFQPRGAWRVKADVARRSLDEIAALLPRLQGKLPAGGGDVTLHVELAGSPSAPTGSITVAANQGPRTVDLVATITTSARGLAIATTGTIKDQAHGTLATIGGGATTVAPFNGKKLDVPALRANATLDVTIDLPERELASLADLRPKLAELGGLVGGKIAVRGTPAKPALDANIRWHGYKTAANTTGETTIKVIGAPTAFTAVIDHNKALSITADVDRSSPDRIAIKARAHAGETPLLPLIPSAFGAKLAAHETGKLSWDMGGTFTLVRGPSGLALDGANITGALDVRGGAIKLPDSNRRWHDIGLAVVADPKGLRIKSLALHESDIENKNRKLEVSGLLGLENLKPHSLSLSLAAHDWLLFGTPQLGANDAPRAAADFDIAVVADLTSPVIGVDATVNSLALRSPDRLDRGHQPELSSISGDIIYDAKVAGLLPVAPAVVAAVPRERRPIDIRIHVPKSIRLNQTPFDVWARGELTVTVRTEGIKTRGGLTMERGSLSLFGREHRLVEGSLTFTEENPKGWLALTFDRRLPDIALRHLGKPGGAKVSFAGSPTKPKTSLHGDANAALFEVMAMYQAGRPVYVSAPNLPASNTVQVPRGDQLFILTFMAQNLPHLLFLDRVAAWGDPYDSAASYGRINNVEAERAKDKTRVRGVLRPVQPGRSTAELQWDRVLIGNDRTAFGVGARLGDRLGGGVGVFLEWSSK